MCKDFKDQGSRISSSGQLIGGEGKVMDVSQISAACEES